MVPTMIPQKIEIGELAIAALSFRTHGLIW